MNWLSILLGNLNYTTVFFLMMLESTVIPVPSELVVSPAAYHAAGGHLNIFLVILFATLGADVGASINYIAAYYLCMLNQEKVEKSEKFFDRHGIVATITGRLIPGIRHLISIPAGLAKMHYGTFLLYTTIGAGLWNCILAILGWYLYSAVPEDQLNDKIMEYGEYIKFAIMVVIALALFYFMGKYLFRRRRQIKG